MGAPTLARALGKLVLMFSMGKVLKGILSLFFVLFFKTETYRQLGVPEQVDTAGDEGGAAHI